MILIALFLICFSAYSQKDTVQAKKVFVPSGKLWGYVFGDFTDKLQTNSFNMSNTQYASTPKDFTSFDYRRIFLGYDYEISEKFSSVFLLASEGQTASDGSRTIFIKAANLRWKNIFKNIDIIMGQQQTSTFSTASETWGYRTLEKSIMDMRKIGLSYDFGVSLQGKFSIKGDFGYSLMVGNGTGAKPENDKFKKIYVDFWTKLLEKKLVLDIGGDNEIAQTTPFKKSKTTLKAFAAYQTTKFSIGFEVFSQLQKNNTTFSEPVASTVKDTVNAVASGFSLWAKGVIKSNLGWVVRYDHYNPDNKFKASNVYLNSYQCFYTESFVMAGLDYIATKNVHVMPNIWYDRYSNRNVAANGLIKSSYDLAARLTVYYIFNK